MRENIVFYRRLVFSLLLMSLVSVFLLMARFFFVVNWYSLFFLWNLFLAWVPLLVAYWLYFYLPGKNIYIQALAIVMWLIFFPNAPYLITDFVHFTFQYNLPLWYDLVMLMSFAWVGLCLGFISLLWVEEFLKKITTTKVVNGLVCIFLLLTSFGVYFGRYMRRNSWDVLTNPVVVAGDLANALLGPNFLHTIGMTIILFLFLSAGHYFFRAILIDKK